MISSTLGTLSRWLRPSPRRPITRQPQRSRLFIEHLEDRVTPAIGLGSLAAPLAVPADTGLDVEWTGVVHNSTHWKVEIGDTIQGTILGATDAYVATTDVNGDTFLNDVLVQIQSSEHGNISLNGTLSGSTITFTWAVPGYNDDGSPQICETTIVAYDAVDTHTEGQDHHIVTTHTGFNLSNNDIVADGTDDGTPNAAAGYAIVDQAGNVIPDLDGSGNGTCGGGTVVTNSTVTIEVHKFEDHDGNGIRDGADSDIAWNFTINVGSYSFAVTTGTSATFDNDADSDTTDVGEASFDGHVLTVTVTNTDLAAGINWSATEADVTGWTHTTATSDSGSLTTVNSSAVALDFGNFHDINICGTKFYDNNANGLHDDSAVVQGWNIVLVGFNTVTQTPVNQTAQTAADGTYCFTDLGPGTYAVQEAAGGAGWIQTYGIGGYMGTASSGVNVTQDFGNLLECKGSGGVTLGFWSNKNGQNVLLADGFSDDSTLLNALWLKNANGSDFNASSYSALKTWLLNATATNMAYMLSAQLATTELSVLEAGTGSFAGLAGSTIVDTGTLLTSFSISGLNVVVDGNNVTHGFITITDLMAAANNQLCIDTDGKSQSGDGNRAIEEAHKTALDSPNNNLLNTVMNVTTSISASATC